MTSETPFERLRARIEGREAVVSVVGLGYVGLPLALAFAEAGFRVVGIDVDSGRVSALNGGESYVAGIPSERLARARNLSATTDYDALRDADAVIVCVPTPLSKARAPDISHIIAAVEGIARRLRPAMLVVLESTTYPGTTREVVLPRLQSAAGQSLKVGKDFFLAYSPERIDPGRADWTIQNTPKLIGGVTERCAALAASLYGRAIERVVSVSSPEVAEMAKLLENTFRAANIALVNEFAIMCNRLGLDVWEVIEAAETKPFGFVPFYPGPGLGGHCIPVDPQYLAWKLQTLNYSARFIKLAEEVNFGMPEYVVGRVADALNEDGKPLRDSKALVLGVTYKANVGDTRESPALDIIRLLRDKGAAVAYHDPYVPELAIDEQALSSVTLNEAALRSADCVLIVSPHDSYDWGWIARHSKLILDTRNATRGIARGKGRIVKL
ncbi:MAG: nucleotide sugar dehydrogenase [Chloroflexi bacterium]|nr:nucleotide sugar dehydrogenase [Chloroflexota bacterium]